MHHYWKSGSCVKCGVNYRYPTTSPCRGAFMSAVQKRTLIRLLAAFQEWPYMGRSANLTLSMALKRTKRNRRVINAVFDAFPSLKKA